MTALTTGISSPLSPAVAPPPTRPHTESMRRRRRALRHLASAVTVVTVRNGDRLHGATVGSATLVSRNPLLLGLCLRSGSATAGLIREEGRFAVNVLAGDQASVARFFSDPNRPLGAAQFAATGWDPAPGSGAPLLRGALAHFSCRIATQVLVGDHEVLLAHVHDAVARDGKPLLSYDGNLHTVAQPSVGPLAAHPAPGFPGAAVTAAAQPAPRPRLHSPIEQED
ncbi:flavin reductase family protein [Streptomyces katsurahamanus]|nr:flavin reductase family protein [Streptomyces katsurahamanus]